MQTKKMYFLLGIIALVMVSLYFIDRKIWMKQRVMKHPLWEYSYGNIYDGRDVYIRGAIWSSSIIKFEKDTMLLDMGNDRRDTLILEWQYFNKMKIRDPNSGKTGVYCICNKI